MLPVSRRRRPWHSLPRSRLDAAARLARAEGGRTRAILKILGRGALLLASGAFELTLWLFSALLALFGFVCSIKSVTERTTQAWLNRNKARRLRKQMAAATAARG